MLIVRDGRASLGKRIKELVTHTDRLDILVGFFYFSGVKAIVEPLKNRPNMHMRVLVGMEAEIVVGQLVETVVSGVDTSGVAIRNRFCDTLRKVLSCSAVDTQEFHERLDLFVRMLEENRLEIRKTLDSNHSKLYIFQLDETQVAIPDRKVWLTGSSNFSEPGLLSRDELNVQIGDFGQQEVQEYFDTLWNLAVPLTATEEDRKVILSIVRDSSVAATVTPFEAYFLVLKQYLDYQKSVLNEDRLNRILNEAGFTRYQYQVDAVAQAMAKLDEYRGVIIADVVGLGKSIIAGLIGALRRRRGLIICPPGLMGSPTGATGGWYEYKNKFKLHDWEIWSRGKLEGILEKLAKDPDFDMVIVDEAHNFRNEKTDDYARLAEICFDKEVILLTATPFNNRPSDLLSLMRLFIPAKASAFGNLEEQFRLYHAQFEDLSKLNKAIATQDWKQIQAFRKACGISVAISGVDCEIAVIKEEAAKVAARLAADIRQVVEKIVIRRNRLDLQTDPDYANELDTLSKVEPPQEQFFELSKDQDAFYDKVLHVYFGEEGRFHGGTYRPSKYLLDQNGLDDSQTNIYKMLLRQLVQRFESSFGAFHVSLKNVKATLQTALSIIERTGIFVYDHDVMEDLMSNPEAEKDVLFDKMLEAEREYEKKLEKAGIKGRGHRKTFLYDMSDPGFNGEEFIKHLKDDIALMEEIIEEIDTLGLLKEDPKARKLLEVLDQVLSGVHPDIPDDASSARKVLVFSIYADTINHITKYVEKRFPGRSISVDGKNFTPAKAKQVKSYFDASYETQVDAPVDILLTTDKLSEGFNLNRAGLVINYDIPWNPTRVIQRVGRINRIGRKVFETLHIFNFFPTVQGSAVATNRAIAENKMFAIHQILGEDAQIFSPLEEPTPSDLYSKLCRLDDDEAVSLYTNLKLQYTKAKNLLQKNHPDLLDRIDRFPPLVKTAWLVDARKKVVARACFMFRKKGRTFSVIAYEKEKGEISEWPLDEALREIECKFFEPRVEFSSDFWQFKTWKKGDDGPRGIYDALKTFKPKGLAERGSAVPDHAQAVQFIADSLGTIRDISYDLGQFATTVILDIQNYGTIPTQTIRRLAGMAREKERKKRVSSLIDFLINMREMRGDHYLDIIRSRTDEESVVVTIEKQ